ncbi:MAG: c-type cytochrome [Anaerolineae bacterium]|nr:c-type cytochrome [Anaerolineae bacterium]
MMHRLSRWRPDRLVFLVCALLLGFAVAGLALAQRADAQGPAPAVSPPTGRPSAARGQELFATNCVPCHGSQGRGDGDTLRAQGMAGPNFANAQFHQGQSLASIYSVISEGRMDKLMPPWKGRLNPDQMWDLAAYSWWLGTGARSLSTGQAVWSAECASCHGATGATLPKSDLSQMAQRITVSQADLAARSAKVPEHAATWAKLSPADQTAALAYGRSLGFDTPALPSTAGVIQGSVRMGTPGATLQAGQVVSVTLLTFAGNTPEDLVSVPVAADGTFKFDSLLTSADYSYGVTTRYNGVDYYSPLVRLAANDSKQATTISVYETTTTDPGVRIAQVHVIAEFLDTQTLRIGELYDVENTGQRTLVASAGGTTFPLTLPTGAVNVRFQDDELDEQKVRDGDQLRIGLAWPPGHRQLLLSYDLPYRGQASLTRAWPYPVSDANVLVADVGLQVQAEGLQIKQTAQPSAGMNYLTYAAQTLPAGRPVTVRLSGTPSLQPASASAGAGSAVGVRVQPSYQSSLRWIGLALALLALASALVWPRLRRVSASGPSRGDIERERLLDRLADLDDAYTAGELVETEYRVQRTEAKARLVQVMRTQRAEE